MKPLLMYVDDEPRNLTVFEASMPEEWEVKCYDNAIEALKALKDLKPWVILSDQKMPKMTGLEFLEVATQLAPDAIRIVVTGHTEEQTIIQLVRRAKIFDYLTKPWDTEVLLSQLKKAIDYYRAFQERNEALEALKSKNKELSDAAVRESDLRLEIGAWTPAPIVWAIKEKNLSLPAKRDLVGITYDIVNSSSILGKVIKERSVKSHIQRMFTQCLMKLGGIRESCAGDSVYGHFGAVGFPQDPHLAAMMVAEEFRVSLINFAKLNKLDLECGIAIHHAPDTAVQVHELNADTPEGPMVQKWFDTDSPHIDLLHRMEKLVHNLPGTNIIMSAAFHQRLKDQPRKAVPLGPVLFKGRTEPVELYVLPSDLCTKEHIDAFKEKQIPVQVKQAG